MERAVCGRISEHVAHPYSQRAILCADVESGFGKSGWPHPHLRIARKAEPFLGHHAQCAVGLSIGVLVMQQGNGIAAGLHAREGKGHAPLARFGRGSVRSRDAAAARKLAFVGSHAGAHDTLGIAQFGHGHADRGPGKRPVFGGRRGRSGRKHRAERQEGYRAQPAHMLGLSPLSVPQKRSQ